MKINTLVKIRNSIDGMLKFPNLGKGDVGVQIGFDLSSANLTSDLWIMANRVGKEGQVIGIDPDPLNHERISPVLEKAGFNATLVRKATYNTKSQEVFILDKRASWNKLDRYSENDESHSGVRKLEVELDTVDKILGDLKVNEKNIRHINITNNGAEFATLQGMDRTLSEAKNLSLTVVAGRSGKMGQIDEKRDYEAIMELLMGYGYKVKFYRKSQLFWWGLVHNIILKRKMLNKDNNYGIVMADKGCNKRRWYQSYS